MSINVQRVKALSVIHFGTTWGLLGGPRVGTPSKKDSKINKTSMKITPSNWKICGHSVLFFCYSAAWILEAEYNKLLKNNIPTLKNTRTSPSSEWENLRAFRLVFLLLGCLATGGRVEKNIKLPPGNIKIREHYVLFFRG